MNTTDKNRDHEAHPMISASPSPEVVIIQFTTTLHAELVLASTVARLERGKWAAKILKTQDAVVRIAKPAGSPHKLKATSTMAGALSTSTPATTWTPLADGGVQSPLIDRTVEFTLELKLVATDGTEVARATPIHIITKGGMPDDLTDSNAETDPEPAGDADAVALANPDPQSEKAV